MTSSDVPHGIIGLAASARRYTAFDIQQMTRGLARFD